MAREVIGVQERPSVYEFAGGPAAFVALALADALHARCVNDPVLAHAFAHVHDQHHLDHHASYLAGVLADPLRTQTQCEVTHQCC